MSNRKMEVETKDSELIFRRTFDAPRELVFKANSSCEHLKHWWGPRSWPMAECTLDFRVGGEWHYCLRGPNPGDESWGKSFYKEIVAPERIVYLDTFSDAEGNVNDSLPQVHSTMTFEEIDGKTRITGRAEYPSAAELETVLEMGMVAGMSESLDRLEEYLVQVNA